jgi:hypothetical protein
LIRIIKNANFLGAFDGGIGVFGDYRMSDFSLSL